MFLLRAIDWLRICKPRLLRQTARAHVNIMLFNSQESIRKEELSNTRSVFHTSTCVCT